MRASAAPLTHPGCLTALFSSLLLGAAGEAGAAIPASERAALIALYNSTNGAGWRYDTNWRNAEDADFAPPGTECTWFGVRCDGDHVIRLRLPTNGLTGSIPTEVGDLTSIGELDLNHNQLTGPIPPRIGNLWQLTYLSLGENQLTGSIPAEIGNLWQLRDLSLGNNQLTGSIPPQIGNLSHLLYLSLGSNQLTGPIPPEVGNFSQLRDLSLGNNQLTGSIPPQIGSLSQLLYLHLSSNQLTGRIPPEIGGLTHLIELYLENNNLSGPIPPEVGNLREVCWVELENNQLGGPLPGEIGNLGANSYCGYLEHLYLDHNQLDGPIPPEIGNLRMGRYLCKGSGHLRLDHNRLSGPIPPEIGRLYMGCGAIELDHNLLSGAIPPEIGDIGYVAYLSLDNNQLTGPIPSQLGNLVSASRIRLQGNRLRGPIPVALSNLTRLRDGESDLRWNALYTSDPTLRAFLDSKQVGGDWEGTQTVAPVGLAAGGAALDSVPLSWSPIPYTGDTGGYALWYGTQAGGPYNLGGTTADKTVSASAVSGLSPGTTYYFALDTLTEPHANNRNAVVSGRTAEVSATTAAGGADWHGLTVVTDGPGRVSSSPEGIDCGGACSATYPPATPVTLAAAPDAGSTFLGWGGACRGTALTCDLTRIATQTVRARFSGPVTSFYTVTPCRVYDSREAGASAALPAATNHTIVVAGHCGIPATAKAVSLNVTVVSPSAAGHIRLHASGTSRPGTSAINYSRGQIRANNALVSLGTDGALIVYVNQPSGTVHVVLDVNGYFQ